MSKELFICSIEPGEDGLYNWLLEIGGKVYGGAVESQEEALLEAKKVYELIR